MNRSYGTLSTHVCCDCHIAAVTAVRTRAAHLSANVMDVNICVLFQVNLSLDRIMKFQPFGSPITHQYLRGKCHPYILTTPPPHRAGASNKGWVGKHAIL